MASGDSIGDNILFGFVERGEVGSDAKCVSTEAVSHKDNSPSVVMVESDGSSITFDKQAPADPLDSTRGLTNAKRRGLLGGSDIIKNDTD